MWLLGFGLAVGIVLGLNVPWQVPSILARYLAVGLLAGVDTSLGGFRAALDGDFDIVIFVTGFLGNVILAAVFVYVGDILGIELYLAAVVALGVRVFNNLGIVRRHLVRDLFQKRDGLLDEQGNRKGL